ncbi:hypothetical protein ACWDR1_10835 [Streptosporangium sandarakinum]
MSENGNSGEASSKSEMATWDRSPERSAVHKFGTIAALVVIITATIALAPAIRDWSSSVVAHQNAQGIAVDALLKFENAKRAEESARAELLKVQAELAQKEASDQASPQIKKQLEKQVEYARFESQAALEKTRTTDARREETWRLEVAAQQRIEETQAEILLRVSLIVGLAVAIFLVFHYAKSEKRREFDNRRILNSLAIRGVGSDDSLTLRALWSDNREQLQLYHRLVLNYANSTRQTTLVTLLAGFTFLVAAGAFALFANSVASAVVISVVSAAGAAVTGFIAQAVLKNSETSSREVLAFFSHPLEVERMLAAERVIEAMPESSRDAAKMLVIQALTRTASDEAPSVDNSNSRLPLQ